MAQHRQLFTSIAIAALTMMSMAGCDFTELGDGELGSGELVTETRDLAEFTAIDASSAVNISIIVDPGAEQSVTVTYDDNMLDNLVTQVSGDTLSVTLEGNINLTGNMDRIVEVVVAELESIEASGASNIIVKGSTDRVEVDLSGASAADLEGLTVGDVVVDASGASTATLFATGSVTGSASGASSVIVRGTPTDVRVETSGASSLDFP